MRTASTLNLITRLAAILALLLSLLSFAWPVMPRVCALTGILAGANLLLLNTRALRPAGWPLALGTILLGLGALAGELTGGFGPTAAMSPAWVRTDTLLGALVVFLTGCGLLGLQRPRRTWFNPSVWWGITVLTLSFASLLANLAGAWQAHTTPNLPAGVAATGLLTGLALITARIGPGYLQMLERESPARSLSLRLSAAVVALPFLLHTVQLFVLEPADLAGRQQLILGCTAWMVALLWLLIYSLRELDRSEMSKREAEAERTGLLDRLQHDAAKLQQEVGNRTQELAAALRLSRRLDHLARSTTNGVMIATPAGCIEWVNPAWERQTGYTLAEVLGRRPGEFLPGPESNRETRARMRAALRTAEAFQGEVLNYRKDGSVFWIDLEIQPIRDERGTLLNFISIQSESTERKRQNEILQKLNERLALALRALDCGVWDYDVGSGRVEWNRRQYEIYGLNPEQFDSRLETFLQRVHPDDRHRVPLLTQLDRSTGDLIEYEFRIIRTDGSLRHVAACGTVRRDAQGRVTRIVGLDRDLTAAVEMREKLKLAEERWQLALAGSNDGIWDLDLVSGHAYYDQRWAEIIGTTPPVLDEEFEAWTSRVHPEDLNALQSSLQAHLEGRNPIFSCEHRLRHTNGNWVWVLSRGRVVARDNVGRALRITGTQADISDRKQLEEQLRESEALSLQLSRLANIGAWEYDLNTRRLTWAPEIFRIHEVDLGYQPDYKRALDFYPTGARQTLEDALQRTALQGTPFDLELPFKTARGHELWIRIQGRLKGKPGDAEARIYGAFQDITARRDAEEMRRKLESQLFQSQKMETLGTMAGGIAHDFNNLLTGILGYHDLALDTLPEDHPSRSCLASAREASLRARELVEQILTFGRQASSEKGPVDLVQLVGDAHRLIRATMPANVRIELDLAPDCDPVKADATQIYQVLLNLGSNAAHALAPAGGVLRLTLRPVDKHPDPDDPLEQLPPGRYLRLEFSDTGHGMDAETCKRIFDPFFTTKEVGKGTGLGLSVVYGIIQAHQGSISVESQPGVGTTFVIHLPAAVTPSEANESEVWLPPKAGGELFAVVDDEEIVRSFTQMALEQAGYRVEVFSQPAECLSAMRRDPGKYAGLLTDQTMPGMQGIELAEAVRQISPHLPIVIMSGYFSRLASETLEKVGLVSLLSKPFTNEELASTVHRAMRRGSSPPFERPPK